MTEPTPRMAEQARQWARLARDVADGPYADPGWYSVAARLFEVADLYESCRDDAAQAALDEMVTGLIHIAGGLRIDPVRRESP